MEETELEEKRRLIREAFAKKMQAPAQHKNLGSQGRPGTSYQAPVGGVDGTEGIPKRFLEVPRVDEQKRAELENEIKTQALQRVNNSLEAAKQELADYQSYMREESTARSIPPEESKAMRMHQSYLVKKIARWEDTLKREESREYPSHRVNTRLSVAFDALEGKPVDDAYSPIIEFIRRQNKLGFYTIDQLCLKFSTTRSSLDYRRRAGLIKPIVVPGMLLKFYSLKEVACTYGPAGRKAFEKVPK